jgi:hypothetical protein
MGKKKMEKLDIGIEYFYMCTHGCCIKRLRFELSIFVLSLRVFAKVCADFRISFSFFFEFFLKST